MPSRILYAGQTVSITPQGAAGTSGVRYLPVQSASCDLTKPLESILSFGHLGSLARIQNSVFTCKSSIKTYLANVTGGTGASNYANLVNTDFLQILTGQALQGQVSIINVTPNGFTMSGIVSNIGLDIANGSFGTADFSFDGVGEPIFAAAPTSSTFSEQSSMPTSFSPVTSTNVAGQVTGGCANSFKFSLDIPNETISCLGGNISGSQGAIASSFLQVAKPPFTAKIAVEGLSVDPPSSGNGLYIIGKLGITLPNGTLDSRGVNNAVGSAGQSFNYDLSDTTVLFTDQP